MERSLGATRLASKHRTGYSRRRRNEPYTRLEFADWILTLEITEGPIAPVYLTIPFRRTITHKFIGLESKPE